MLYSHIRQSYCIFILVVYRVQEDYACSVPECCGKRVVELGSEWFAAESVLFRAIFVFDYCVGSALAVFEVEGPGSLTG